MSKRRPERPSTSKNSKSWQTDFVEYANPLANLPEAERMAVAAAVATNAEERFHQSAAEIADILATCDPPLILANMAIHFFGIQDAGEREVPAELIIQQHHIELLQALALRAPIPGRRERRVATSVSDLMPLVRENAIAFLQRVKIQPGDARDNKLKVAQHQIRGDTQTVRGEFHAEQTERYLRAIFARLDGPFHAAYGVSGSHVVDTLMGLLRRVELKINAWRKMAIRVFRERKDQKALKAFVAGFSQYSEADVKALLAAARVGTKCCCATFARRRAHAV